MADANNQQALDAPQKGPSITLLGPKQKVVKGETSELVMSGSEAYPEDSFNGMYASGVLGNTNSVMEPSFKPGTLYTLTTQNNILLQCIEAMEVNVDGTGHSIDLIEEQDENEVEKQTLTDFFANPFPGLTMIMIRRAIRRDIEATGNGYMELISNAAGGLMMVNHLDANYLRLVRLDDAVPVKKMLKRGGKEIEVVILMRERRYVQFSAGLKVYFKEFGASRDLNRLTGEWAPAGTRLPAKDRASEVKHWIGNKEPKTAYGTPRWINQLPSVLGSRKAEEHNLEFFDAGGVPPMLILVQGGTLGSDVTGAIAAHMSTKGSSHRAAIIEATSTSGSIDGGGNVRVSVERFGAERQADSMFQNYDAKCEDHVRVAFRLPPLFVGKAADYNFATAYTAYMIAEAQVFWPEREEFDNWINENVVKRLGVKNYKFRSLPLTLTDVTNQLTALEMVIDKFVDGEDIIKKLNEITGLSLEYKKQEPPAPPPGLAPAAAIGAPQKQVLDENGKPVVDAKGKPAVDAKGKAKPLRANPTPLRSVKAEEAPIHLRDLADRVTEVLDGSGVTVCSKEDRDDIRLAIGALNPQEFKAFSAVLAAKSVQMAWADTADVEELCACAVHGSV